MHTHKNKGYTGAPKSSITAHARARHEHRGRSANKVASYHPPHAAKRCSGSPPYWWVRPVRRLAVMMTPPGWGW
eukprot:scaffold111404_cov65-Phaeocystis_antarctica.AAC.8